MSIKPGKISIAGVGLGLVGLFNGVADAQQPQALRDKVSLPRPVTLTSLLAVQESNGEAIASPSAQLPASITAPNGILPLATGQPFVFDPLPTLGSCSQQPDLRCTGPDYVGCTPRIYYATDARDDDPVLTMSPTVCDPKTMHWYEKAFHMVLRKNAIADAIND